MFYEEEVNVTEPYNNTGSSSWYNPSKPTFTRGNEKTIATSVYNRIALDASAIDLRHVKMDEEDRFLEFVNSGLDNCLHMESNIDQTGRAFILDVVISMLDEGSVAVVPTVCDDDLDKANSFGIEELRTGRIVQWYPKHVRVSLYNDDTGMRQEVTLPKSKIAIIENPLYAVINEPNSTMQRLIRKLSLMDTADEELTAGNLDLIIQLPYAIKTEAKKNLAEDRRKELEAQLNGAKYGVGYIDGLEKVTQLNRPIENNLLKQVEYLTTQLYSQLGITQSILDGTADENTMNNYYNRTIEPILNAIVEEFRRKFLTKTARTQRQTILYFRDPFRLMPVGQVSEIADKFTRNEIMSSNEVRQKIGMKPSKDPAADELRNKNLSQAKEPRDSNPEVEEVDKLKTKKIPKKEEEK